MLHGSYYTISNIKKNFEIHDYIACESNQMKELYFKSVMGRTVNVLTPDLLYGHACLKYIPRVLFGEAKFKLVQKWFIITATAS